MFDDFFGSPTWRYFAGENGEDVVEFTGWCVYRDVEVEARLQFLLDMENGTFETGAMSFNEVPQTKLITYAMIEKAFSDYVEKQGDNSREKSDIQIASETISEDLESREFESTDTGTAEGMLNYIGNWSDNRCHVTIENAGIGQFRVEIVWGSSAFENSEWVMTAVYDGNTGILNYTDCVQKDVVYPDNGTTSETIVYENGTGSFYMKNGYLYWDNETAHAGDECRFEKDEDISYSSSTVTETVIDPDTPYYAEEAETDYGDEDFILGYSSSRYYTKEERSREFKINDTIEIQLS